MKSYVSEFTRDASYQRDKSGVLEAGVVERCGPGLGTQRRICLYYKDLVSDRYCGLGPITRLPMPEMLSCVTTLSL